MAEKSLAYNFNVCFLEVVSLLYLVVFGSYQSFLQLFCTAIIFLADSALCSAS